jgi:hypothetical protein
VNSYWISEYKIDGFRFDFTKGFSNTPHGMEDPWGSNYDAARISILKRMADEIWKRDPETIIIFEHLSENAEEKELADHGILLWGNMSYSYQEAAMSYCDNGKSDFSWINYKKRNWNDPHVVGYMESHDEERVAYKCVTYGNSSGNYSITDTATTLKRLALNALFFLTVPGPKMIWQFGEMGYDYSINYNGRLGEKPARWDYLQNYQRKYLSDFYGALIKLRTENPAFETDNFTMNVAVAMKRIILVHDEMDAVVLGNFDVKPGALVPGFTHTGTWYEYFTGQPLAVTDLNASLTLEAGEYRFYTDVFLETPQIHTGYPENAHGKNLLRIFPNPSDRFNIEITLGEPSSLTLEVFDLAGRKTDMLFSGRLPSGSHRFVWSGPGAGISPGIYILKACTEAWTECCRIIFN